MQKHKQSNLLYSWSGNKSSKYAHGNTSLASCCGVYNDLLQALPNRSPNEANRYPGRLIGQLCFQMLMPNRSPMD